MVSMHYFNRRNDRIERNNIIFKDNKFSLKATSETYLLPGSYASPSADGAEERPTAATRTISVNIYGSI